MSTLVETAQSGTAAVAPASDLYRAVWRWHFYAGLLVLPFLISLACTGALYLFKDEFDAIIHSDLKRVEASQTRVAPLVMIEKALAAVPGRAVKFTDPATPQSSAEITIATASAGKQAVYVNPHDGQVLGTLPDRGTIMWTIRTLHSLKYFGTTARYLIEIAAGWSILLVATGIYLWWPRRQTGGVLTVRGTPRRRIFWRDTHAVTGILVGFFIVFLAITGMPWSGVWGDKVNEWANGSNDGYPAGLYVGVPMSTRKLSDTTPTSWSMEQAKLPLSTDPHSGHTGHDATTTPAANVSPAPGSAISIDSIILEIDAMGFSRGYAVTIPGDPTGVYSATVYPDDVSLQRVVHFDQYSGKPLIDLSYGDYGVFGKALEFGISVHMGQQFGLLNQILLSAVCLAIILLAVSAAIMWWKRRPAGALGVPPMPSDPRTFRGLIAILAIGGIAFPLVGVSLLTMLAIDRLFFMRRTEAQPT
ncbi:PepSY domain-containing protein [Mesorhizobium sp. NBSH29]|uniref:PepSY-associated TM helix domain-containing protein n=1 Tax=Mesorhizobium sp. NBSH29 TaxID=2654249 RepID=UPI0018965FBB|nr:PepSY domain-containing protein [Mesorhizobium sp. NBSH29]QPC86867.1 PepSY domain-containing protein [Mesorhizobium sp. NBSH29]